MTGVKAMKKTIARAGLGALVAGLVFAGPSVLAGDATGSCDANTTACCGKCGEAKPAKKAKKAKASKKSPKPVKVTGSNLDQRVVPVRYPATTSPVEIVDRAVMARSGTATLSEFMARQATYR